MKTLSVWCLSSLVLASTAGCARDVASTESEVGSSSRALDGKGPPQSISPVRIATEGGPVLKHPKVMPIFFTDTRFQSEIVDFLGTFGTGDFWSTSSKEYGVGVLQARPAVRIPTPAPNWQSDGAAEGWLLSELNGQLHDLGTPDPETIYTVFLPPTAVLSGACTYYGAYHSNLKIKGVDVPIAMIGDCGLPGIRYWCPTCNVGVSEFDRVALFASHELNEASTDPYPWTDPAYDVTDDKGIAWNWTFPTETGDLCEFRSDYYRMQGGYLVQRMWSNSALDKGRDPCVPYPPNNTPYFNTAAVMPDTIEVLGRKAPGVFIAEGETRTIELKAFSIGKADPWEVSVDNATSSAGDGQLELSLDRTTVSNGDTIHLTIHVVRAGEHFLEPFYVRSVGNNDRTHWTGLVHN